MTGGPGNALGLLLLYALASVAYMAPTVVAYCRGHPNRWLIAAVNVPFGATASGG